MRKAERAIIIAIVLAVVAGVVIYSSRPSGSEAAIIGVVRATEVRVEPEVNGQLVSIAVKKGDHVRAGDIVARLSAVELTAQADQARSLIEYRQAELRLEQLHTEIRMQVVNAQFALTNDRAQVVAARAAQDFAQQSLDAETKKLNLGASTAYNVLLQQKNLATAENSLIAAEAAYAGARAGLFQTLATTLQHYGINLGDAATGTVSAAPMIPGLTPAKSTTVAPTK